MWEKVEFYLGELLRLLVEAVSPPMEEDDMANALQVDMLAAGVVDASGAPLAGGKVYTYAAGTTSAMAVYTDSSMTTEATNPVVLNEAGVANVYGYGNYKFSIYDASDVLVRTLDNQYYIVTSYTTPTVTTVTTDTTLTAVTQVIKGNTTSGSITLTLPTAVGNMGLRIIAMKTSAANTLTLDGNASETINGSATFDLTANNEVAEIISDNANWVIINSNASGTVTLSGTQTFTNKSLVDSTTYIVDDGDATKILQFQCSGITTGNTRTLTVPNFSGTIATVAGTETLTNKTLTSPTLTSPSIGTGLIMAASPITRSIETDGISITASATPGNGAYIMIYGPSHATYPEDMYLFGDVNIEVQAWVEVTVFGSDWTGFNNVYYMKDPFGFVHLRGKAINGTDNNAAACFQLPSGYRPEADVFFPSHYDVSAGKLRMIYIDTDGYVAANDGAAETDNTDIFYLDGITFKAA